MQFESCNISTFHIYENVQNKICNLQIRNEQFTDQRERAKKHSLIGTELSINDNTRSPKT